jgi:hypothetical protein
MNNFMINEKDNQIHEKITIINSLEQNDNKEDMFQSNSNAREYFESNTINADIHSNQNQTINELMVENECLINNDPNEEKEKFPINPVQEEKSSIFNSKNLVNKSVFEQFFEQNNFLYLSNIYEEQIHSSEDLQNNINYEEKIDIPVKSSSKISIPLNRNSSEKQIKRKKNMNNLKRELDTPLTHSIFEKNEAIEEFSPKEEEPKYPYKPLDKDKEEKIENYCEQYFLNNIVSQNR